MEGHPFKFFSVFLMSDSWGPNVYESMVSGNNKLCDFTLQSDNDS